MSTVGLVRLAVVSFFIAVSAGAIWTVLLVANLAVSPAIPWASPVALVFLWMLYRYLAGDGPPRGTSAARRLSLRATALPLRVFLLAVLAGGFGIVALSGLWPVLMQLGGIPGRPTLDFSGYPLLSVVAILATGSLVTAVAEEAAIRGYLLSALERRLPAAGAIIVSALVLAPGHAFTQGFVWPVLLFYLCVDVLFGAMAYLTKSIVPGIVVHAVGLLVFFTLVWPADVARTALSPPDGQIVLWIALAQTLAFGAIALFVFRALARTATGQRAPSSGL